MYYQRSNNHQFNQNKRFNRPRFRHVPKPIDPRLFVNKAVEEKQKEQAIKHQFSDFLVAQVIKNNIAEKGYTTPTPIQDQVIPHVLEGRDVIGIANTGTGKTGAFLIPLINKVYYNKNQRVLIIAPTRELAVQIQDECRIFAKNMGIFTTLAIGGASSYHQISALKSRPQFVIGTPGRLKEFTQTGKVQLETFQNTVLDEVDRMMDMGFINDIRFLISKLPQNRQSLFFSATVPPQVAPLMQTFLRNPITVSVKTQETVETVVQDVVKINGRDKVDVLCDLLRGENFDKVLVFGRTKWGIEKLSKILIQRGISALAIHGNKNQNQRQRALGLFKTGEVKVLLATDVASRGLDIDDVSHVINYDQPASFDDYVHRIGRTGRANKRGIALTFIP